MLIYATFLGLMLQSLSPLLLLWVLVALCIRGARPRRPAAMLAKDPASTERVFKPGGCQR